jgi:hypothetical protein
MTTEARFSTPGLDCALHEAMTDWVTPIPASEHIPSNDDMFILPHPVAEEPVPNIAQFDPNTSHESTLELRYVLALCLKVSTLCHCNWILNNISVDRVTGTGNRLTIVNFDAIYG